MKNSDLNDSRIQELERRLSEVQSRLEGFNSESAQGLSSQERLINDQQKSLGELIDLLKEATPSWTKDGGGVRGENPEVFDERLEDLSQNLDKKLQQFEKIIKESQKLGDEPEAIVEERQQSETQVVSHPFKIFSRQNPNNEDQYIVTVNAGTINGIIAGNFEDEFNAGSTSIQYVVLNVNTNGLSITSSTLDFTSIAPSSPAAEKWALSSSFSVLIGAVRGGSVKQVVFNNLSATGVKRLTTEKQNIQLQQLPYDNWYAWQVS
jgi:uncharacterized coiled-coil protein SlyX